ncbi:LutC/YkgG family protein [Oryzibacter oryziterrae]|uniref:LutC/YkgG family protein n=1 Tax=Oryzibacter oryziterrae TaxID=2766474 RepID=UPI001F1A8F8E|nr:lactate utilization protein [Oryzibacter oryziterrae]
MSSRDAILARVRRSIGSSGADLTRRATVIDRLTRRPKSVIPARGQLPPDERTALFCAKAEAVFASVKRVQSATEVPEAVVSYLRSNNLPQAVRMGADGRLSALPWNTQRQLIVAVGPSAGDDLVCVSYADAGVAETGTAILTSGPHNPTTLNFLPDHHLIVVHAGTIAGDYETVWAQLRDRFGVGVLPRTVNMITGPSRSADIEQTLLLGAHGPRSLHLIVVG